MPTVLVCAATRPERDACHRGIVTAERSSDHEVLLTGVGPERAARALEERLTRGPLPDLVVSSGFAGALGPIPALLSWIIGTRIDEWDGVERVPVEGVMLVVGGPPGLVGSEVLSSSELWSAASVGGPVSGTATPLVVDMESAALARVASGKGVPMAVVRLITDTPAHPLPAFLAPVTAAMAATDRRKRLELAARGLREALTDPGGAFRLATHGGSWVRELEQGWVRLARSAESWRLVDAPS